MPITIFLTLSARRSLHDSLSRPHRVQYKRVEASRKQRGELKSKTGKTSVPSCWVNGVYVGGCNDGPEKWMGIKPMIRSGKLAELLEQKTIEKKKNL